MVRQLGLSIPQSQATKLGVLHLEIEQLAVKLHPARPNRAQIERQACRSVGQCQSNLHVNDGERQVLSAPPFGKRHEGLG